MPRGQRLRPYQGVVEDFSEEDGGCTLERLRNACRRIAVARAGSIRVGRRRSQRCEYDESDVFARHGDGFPLEIIARGLASFKLRRFRAGCRRDDAERKCGMPKRSAGMSARRSASVRNAWRYGYGPKTCPRLRLGHATPATGGARCLRHGLLGNTERVRYLKNRKVSQVHIAVVVDIRKRATGVEIQRRVAHRRDTRARYAFGPLRIV